MKLAVAGANGWLGSQIVYEAVKRFGESGVLCLYRPGADLSRLQALPPSVMRRTSDDGLDALREFQPDTIICTVCSYKTQSEYIEESIDANYAYPAKLLIDAQATGCPSFISIATSLPPELNLYAFTKAQFSQLGRFLVTQGRISFTSFRCEAIYGMNEQEDRFISRVIKKLKAGEPLELTEGTQHRDFVWLEDVVDSLLFLSSSSTGHQKRYLELSMGSGSAPSIREIILFLKEKLHSSSELHFGAVPLRKNEPDLCADLTALRALGYTRKPLTWREGLKKLIEKENFT